LIVTSLSLASPLGPLTLTEEDRRIVALVWGDSGTGDKTPLLSRARDQLTEYFRGTRRMFDLPLTLLGTSFQRSVWQAMCAIPYGETRAYGGLADDLSSSARAVGTACGRNPIPVIIPCHRVIGKSGALTGYSGGDGINTKLFLLTLEGGAAQGKLAL
jgi:methylated-DNA-[protein]-cysteine S-methyltransferase